jgi:biopolymer transport protein ExbD
MYYEIKAQRSRRRKVLINITPLIDVLFLLLIFFIVSSTFLEQPSITVELPSAETSEAERIEEYVITVSSDGITYINDLSIPREALLPKLEAIYRREPEANIILKADTNVSYGVIIDLIDTVRKSGLKKIVALTKATLSAS